MPNYKVTYITGPKQTKHVHEFCAADRWGAVERALPYIRHYSGFGEYAVELLPVQLIQDSAELPLEKTR